MNTAINIYTWKDKWSDYRKHPSSMATLVLVWGAALLAIAIVLFFIGYIIFTGVGHIKPQMFAWNYNSENVSMTPAIINTLIMICLTLLIAVPVGIFSAIYLVEYAKRGSKLVSAVRLTTETLSGIPSIVFGLFGFILFVLQLRWGNSILAGAITLSMMILPLIMRTTEEALMAVPDSFREGSFGLGAGRLRTIFRVVLPSAVPGILAGVILSIGRIVGESAALIFTAGTDPNVPNTLLASGRTLSVHMYCLYNEGLHTSEAYATAVVLLLFVILINLLSNFVAGRLTRRNING